MVKSRSVQRRENEMGQTSSQPEPQQIDRESATMAEGGKGKEKKSKSKKGKKKNTVEQLRLDEEQESARALMQLAQGSVEHSRAPFYENNPQTLAQSQAEDSQHEYEPDMTSQEIIAHTSQEYSSDGRSKKKGKKGKKKRAREEVVEALDNLEVNSVKGLARSQLSASPLQGSRASPANVDIGRRRSLQALDDSSTGDEVEEYQELSQLQQTAKDPTQSSAPLPEGPLEEAQANNPRLPEYSAPQIVRGIDEAAAAKPEPRRKQKEAAGISTDATDVTDATQSWVDQVADSQPLLQDGKGPCACSPDSACFELTFLDRAGSADIVGQMQGPDSLIDPVLHSMNTQSPSRATVNTLDFGAVRGDAKRRGSNRARKRRRLDELNNVAADQGDGDEEIPYYSPYATHERRGGPSDHTLVGRDMADQQVPPEIGSSFAAEPAMNGRAELNYTDMTDHQQHPLGYETANRFQQNNGHESHASTRIAKPKRINKDHFGPSEVAKLEAFRDSYCEANNKTTRQFNEIIQSNIRGNPQAVALFSDIQDLFPTHRRSYVQRFCRRKFHNFSARGTWTPEEDEMLRRAVSEKGTSWKIVGEMIDRFPEDCRDRYRNYLANAEHRNREQWTEAEILNLAGAIVDCVETMRIERHRQKQEKYGFDVPMSDGDEQDGADTKLINWQAVSDRMGAYGGGRSRLQCSFKWNKLKDRDRRRYIRDIREPTQGLNALQAPNDNHTTFGGWRMKQASKRVTKMLPGDRYDLLRAILQCGAPSEGNIPWKSIGEDWWQRRWSTTERKAGWLMMKRELPGYEGMDYRDMVYKLLTPLLQQGIDERWDPTEDGQNRKRPQQHQKKKKASPETKKKSSKGRAQPRRRAEEANMIGRDPKFGLKSSEYVNDSDDAAAADDDYASTMPTTCPPAPHPANLNSDFEDNTAPQNLNHFDPLLTPNRGRHPSARRHRGGSATNSNDDVVVAGGEVEEEGRERSVHSPNSLFDDGDEDEDKERGDIPGPGPGAGVKDETVLPDEGVSRELAGKVLALQEHLQG